MKTRVRKRRGAHLHHQRDGLIPIPSDVSSQREWSGESSSRDHWFGLHFFPSKQHCALNNRRQRIEEEKEKEKSDAVGLEPTTFGSEAQCAIRCATRPQLYVSREIALYKEAPHRKKRIAPLLPFPASKTRKYVLAASGEKEKSLKGGSNSRPFAY